MSGCAILAIIIYIAAGYLFTRFIVTQLNSSPPKRTGPYSFFYWSESAKVNFNLPDGYGNLTYGHYVLCDRPGAGMRACRLKFKNGKTQEWPLPYSQEIAVKISVYWYPEKNGYVPFLRFYGVTGESILDIKRKEIGVFESENGEIFMSDYEYNDYQFGSSSLSEWAGKGTQIKNGKPAPDLTSVLLIQDRRYLGSIYRNGNKLIFIPSSNTKQ